MVHLESLSYRQYFSVTVTSSFTTGWWIIAVGQFPFTWADDPGVQYWQIFFAGSEVRNGEGATVGLRAATDPALSGGFQSCFGCYKKDKVKFL